MSQKLKLKQEEISVFETLKNIDNSIYRLIFSLAKQTTTKALELQEKKSPSK